MTPSRRGAPAGAVLALGLWLGLAYGLLEGLEFTVLGAIPGALSWRTGNSLQVLWVAPIVYGVGYAAFSLPFAALARVRRGVRWELPQTFLLVTFSAFLGATLLGRILSDLSALVLAIGFGAVGVRFLRARPRLATDARRSLPWLAGLVAAAALSVYAGYGVRERLAMGSLHGTTDRPNVLLIVLDTQRADHLSSYGYGRPTTPRLDALAAEGIRFESAWATSSWTLPTHASLFTGRPPHEHRAGDMRRPYLDGRFPTLAGFLRRNGYATGGFVANTFWCGRQTRLDRGFIRYEDFYGSVGDALARTVLGRRLAYEVLPRLGWLVDIPGRKRAETIGRDALAWIDGLDGRPFFAFLNYFDVHGPYLPPPSTAGLFSGGAETARRRAREIRIGALTGDITLPAPEELRAMRDAYDESLLYLDSELGRLFDGLRERGLLDETIVIVTSDHGESWGEHGFLYHGHSLYPDQIRAPLIVRLPGARRAGTVAGRAVGIDRVPATVADLLGLASPFPGPSLLESLGPRPDERFDPVLAEVSRRSLVPADWPSSRGWVKALVDGDWLYIRLESGTEELYDWRADPAAERDRSAEPSSRPLVVAFREALRAAAGVEPPSATGAGDPAREEGP
ncbi:MAG: sulfatase [Gemmatimonadota bacterium]